MNSNSSGMCKAGFAGDDAPRAVFRKLDSQAPGERRAIWTTLIDDQLLLLEDLAIMVS